MTKAMLPPTHTPSHTTAPPHVTRTPPPTPTPTPTPSPHTLPHTFLCCTAISPSLSSTLHILLFCSLVFPPLAPKKSFLNTQQTKQQPGLLCRPYTSSTRTPPPPASPSWAFSRRSLCAATAPWYHAHAHLHIIFPMPPSTNTHNKMRNNTNNNDKKKVCVNRILLRPHTHTGHIVPPAAHLLC